MAVSKRLRFEVLRRDNHTCRYCGQSAPDVKMTVDHVIPVSLGGNDEPSNLVAACAPCNSGKSSVPSDAPLITDVAEDALRWARAMQLASEELELERIRLKTLEDSFSAEWCTWKDWRGNTIDRPSSWAQSLDQFRKAGLSDIEMCGLIAVAMEAKSRDTWRYFCGCCWTRIRRLQDRAMEIVKETA